MKIQPISGKHSSPLITLSFNTNVTSINKGRVQPQFELNICKKCLKKCRNYIPIPTYGKGFIAKSVLTCIYVDFFVATQHAASVWKMISLFLRENCARLEFRLLPFSISLTNSSSLSIFLSFIFTSATAIEKMTWTRWRRRGGASGGVVLKSRRRKVSRPIGFYSNSRRRFLAFMV